jgi:uncharacterized membrane-anchored protein
MRRRLVVVAVVALVQAVLVVVAVAPRLSAQLRGEEYQLRVAPVDPIDPFRGAYVDLDYPDLQPRRRDVRDLPSGTVYVPLVERDTVWVGDGVVAERPDQAPYLTCASSGWGLSCGIESWFTGQDEAVRLENAVADGAVATVRIDDRGNAVIVDLSVG